MHPLFRLTETLPVPAGESPFHLRGLYYSRLVARAQSLPGGLEALSSELRDDSVRKFIHQKFNWDGWYDALPTMPIYVALARLTGQDFEESVREATRAAAHKLVPSVFRFFVQFTSPTALAARVPQVVMQSVDFVRVSLEQTREDRLVGTGAGIPAIIAPNIANLVLGFFQGALEMGGTRNIAARYTDVEKDGERDGFETLRVRYEFTWSPRGAKR